MLIDRTIETRQDFAATIGDDKFTARLFEGHIRITMTRPDHGGAHVDMPAALLPRFIEFASAVCAAAVPPIVTPEPEPTPELPITEGGAL